MWPVSETADVRARSVIMAYLGFALLAAYIRGASISELARKLDLPEDWVRERIEAARLCLL
jgi:hypothetical protein